MLGEDAFILPDGLKGGDMPLMPYVFTVESLNDFFQYTDTMEHCYRSAVRHLVAPVMFRFMYCLFHFIITSDQSITCTQPSGPSIVNVRFSRIGATNKLKKVTNPFGGSFRHSFATHRIYRWRKEGLDIASLLPGLSVYMGHTKYQHTLYYLHFLPELFSSMAGFDYEQFSDILPEVSGDD